MLGRLSLALVAVLGVAPATRLAHAAEMRIVAPSAPGTGWDQIARGIAASLASEVGLTDVEVSNAPGANGTVGLARFAGLTSGPDLLVTGLAMMDASLLARASITPDRLTPIARLSADPFVVAVAVKSPLQTADDLKRSLVTPSGKLTWAGGPLGGVDHAATLALGRAAGLGPSEVTFVPFLSSAEAASAAADETVTCAFLALADLDAELKAGRLRILATATAERISGPDIPTLTEAGLAIEWANWRGLVARADLDLAETARLVSAVSAAVRSPGWQQMLVRKGWRDAFLPGEAFGVYLRQERARLTDTLKASGMLKQAVQ